MIARNKTLLTLGRGEVFFRAEGENGERYIGNTPSFQITREVERIDVYSSFGGFKHKGRSKVISESIEIRMMTDHMSAENIELWYGKAAAQTTAGDEFIPYVEFIQMERGRFYQLGLSVVPTGLRHVDRVVLKIGSTTLRAGIEYLFDSENGRIEILPDAPYVEVPSSVRASFTKRPSISSVIELAAKEVYGSLRYIARDPYGPRVNYWIPLARVTPRGAVEMKEDGFRQIGFDITALKTNPLDPLMYVIQEGKEPLPLTADTVLVTADTTNYTADKGLWVTEG